MVESALGEDRSNSYQGESVIKLNETAADVVF